MPVTYVCDHCGKESATGLGWLMAALVLYYDDPNRLTPPGGRTQEYAFPDHYFDTEECRSAWLVATGLVTAADIPPPSARFKASSIGL